MGPSKTPALQMDYRAPFLNLKSPWCLVSFSAVQMDPITSDLTVLQVIQTGAQASAHLYGYVASVRSETIRLVLSRSANVSRGEWADLVLSLANVIWTIQQSAIEAMLESGFKLTRTIVNASSFHAASIRATGGWGGMQESSFIPSLSIQNTGERVPLFRRSADAGAGALAACKGMGRAREGRVDKYLQRDEVRNGIGRYKLRIFRAGAAAWGEWEIREVERMRTGVRRSKY
ncbi:hypothetical protein DFJ58DRAFT_843051 [Suillus subalutaceus]|uniref:uncharacterized protein n=1 Tax=Suillus subalutaceus TaxID=48586 RepID=UPI001B869C7B|nr:uncharacterized protein DFJ58DRAFT_843051 [Suillus subalutaceus]KAG1847839.1 hypothetical protein DFJ58DRAFT_843051 [Suillus subalutaceus]